MNVPFAQIFFDNLKLNFELYAKKVLSKNPRLKIYIPKQSFDIVSLYSLFSGFQRRAKVKIKSGRYIIKNLTIFLNLPDSFKGMWGDMMVENLTLLKDTFYVNVPQLSLNFSGKDIKLFLKLLSKGIESLSNLKLSLSFKKLNLAKIDLIGDMKTKINLSVFSPDIKYGKSDINLNFSGFVFPNEKKFDLNGNLIFVLKNFLLKSLKRQIDKIEASAGFKISPNEQNFYLTNFSFKAGKSYIIAKGSGYNKASLESKTPNIRGNFSVYSTLIDLNELLKETKQTQKKMSPKKETLALKVPKFIKLNLKAKLNKIIFKKETISNLVFNIRVLNGNIYIDNLSMNAYGGKIFGKISMLTSSPTKVYVDSVLPPVSNPKCYPTEASVGETITFDGSNSYDKDAYNGGYIDNYTWVLEDGADSITLYGKIVTYAFHHPGIYRAYLTVTDNDGLKDTAYCVYHVVEDTNGPVADIEPDDQVEINVNEEFTFNAYSSQGDIVQYDWYGRKVGDLFPKWHYDEGKTFTVKYTSLGTKTIKLKVHDSSGATDIDTIQITVVGGQNT